MTASYAPPSVDKPLRLARPLGRVAGPAKEARIETCSRHTSRPSLARLLVQLVTNAGLQAIPPGWQPPPLVEQVNMLWTAARAVEIDAGVRLPAYLSYDQYLRNRQQLRDNMYNFAKKGRGAPRNGMALLQGLVLCGVCGRRMTVSHGREYRRYECRRAQLDYAAAPCQAFPVRHLDAAVAAVFLDAVQPAALGTALEAFAVMERERRDLDRHWQLRIERARYEAERAQRQYDAVEPENRSVARSLEARWNAALEALEALKAEHAVMQRTDLLLLGDADRAGVQRLATDLPALWRAETTTMADRKRLLRLVVTEVTLTTQPQQRRADVKVLWCGGAVTAHTADRPPGGQHQRTAAGVVDRLAELAGSHPDHQVAARLNAEGLRTRTGKEWTYARVQSMRKQHAIPTGCPLEPDQAAARADGLVSSRTAADRLGVSLSLVNLWVKQGVLMHDQRVTASKVWVRLNDDDLARLTGKAAETNSLPTFASVRLQAGMSRPGLWHLVRAGRYLAFRVPHGQTWQWRLKEVQPADKPEQPTSARRDHKGNTPYE